MRRQLRWWIHLPTLLLVTACGDADQPTQPEAVPAPDGLGGELFQFDVYLDAPSGARGGVAPGTPRRPATVLQTVTSRSLLGNDFMQIRIIPQSIRTEALVGARRRVSLEIEVHNRLSTAKVTGPTALPVPPAGTRGPILFALESTAILHGGGVSGSGNEVTIELPGVGSIQPSLEFWTGPPHNLFNSWDCSTTADDCRPWLELTSPSGPEIRPGAAAYPVRVGWEMDVTLTAFRVRLVLAGDLSTDSH
jgi:hypothetical protein